MAAVPNYSAIFDQVLVSYRTNMSTYKMTGDESAKYAADQAKRWVTQYLQWMEGTVSANSQYINKFVAEYSTANPELAAMQTKLQTIKGQGPKLENTYRTDKEAAETTPRDFSPYYIKGGVILGVAALLAVLSL
jgi:hypothetical protein